MTAISVVPGQLYAALVALALALVAFRALGMTWRGAVAAVLALAAICTAIAAGSCLLI